MKSKVMFICMFLLILCSLSIVSAQDITTNETQITQDLNDGVLTDASTDLLTDSQTGSFDDLQKEINKADSKSIVYLERDYKASEGANIKLDKSLTIDGQGHTLDCGAGHKNVKAFTSEKGDITLKNLRISHGHDDKKGTGGAIFITGTAKYTIINCTFINNWADNYGGAIYNNVAGNTLTIIDSTFKENEADDDYGGAIYSKGGLEIFNSIFEKNHANIDGGAVYAEKSISVYQSTFRSNKAEPWGSHECYGGAICAKDEFYALDCIFDNNFADDDGGAIYVYKSAFINNCTFTKNNAYDEGGAIYKSGSDYLSIHDSTFTENKATTDNGGAIYCAGKTVVSDSTFTSNSANDCGGAIYAVYIQFSGKVSFIKNHANDDGGAIYASETANFMENLYFESNTADDGHGGAFFIFKPNGELTFYNSSFIKNCAKKGDGGAIMLNNLNKLRLISCIFNENYVDGGATQRWGGAVHSKGDIHVSNSTFYKNWAEDYGGAIYSNKKVYVDSNSEFIGNYVKDNDGGAIWCKEVDIKDSLFVSNTAAENGGAVNVGSGIKIFIKNSYFESNSAGDCGGALYFSGIRTEISLINNVFVSNKAKDEGDDVFSKGTFISISGNWWGTNSPSFTSGKLIEYDVNPFSSNDNRKDGSYNTVKASIDSNEGYVDVKYTVKINFAKKISPFLLDKIQMSSNMAGSFSDKHVDGNSLVVNYMPRVAGNHKITIKVNSQTLTLNLAVKYTSVYGEDLVKVQGDSKTFSAVFKDANGNYLPPGTEVTFNAGGVLYNHAVSDNGVATFDELLTFSPGVYEVKSYNLKTNDLFTNKITILSRNVTYNLNDTFIMNFANLANKSENESVTFKIAGKTFVSNITRGFAYFQLDVPAGKHTIDVMYKGSLVQRIDIEVLNQYSKAVLDVDGNNYAAFLPISNEETFKQEGTVVYSEIGKNLRRYVFPAGNGLIVYNVTVSNNNEFNNVLEEIAKKDFYADVIIINLKKNTYKLKKGSYRDQEWNYNIHLTHGSLYINGNGATIDDDYENNFITIESGCEVSIQDLNFKRFYRVFVNNGDLLCKNCNFIENEAYFISTSTPGSVIYNKNKATFEYCTLDSNRNYIYNTVDAYQYNLQGAVYADANSLTQFVGCHFKDKDKDSLRAVDGSMVILYDDDDTNYKFFTTGVESTLELGSCLDLRPISSYNSNETEVLYLGNVFDLASKINDEFWYDDASSFMVYLTTAHHIQEISKEDFEKIASPNDYRTYNREHDFITQPGPKDNNWVHHKYLLEVGSRPIVIDGKGAEVILKDSERGDDNHFAFVPNYGSLTLINMTIKGFNTAIVNYGELIVIDCTFDGNEIHYAYQTIESENGGAIRNYGKAYIYNSTFVNNRATEGAAYFSKGIAASGQFYNCTFKGNTIISNLVWNNGDSNNLFVDGKSVVKLINCKGIHEGNIIKDNGGLVLYRDNLKESVLNINIGSLADLYRLSNLVKYNSKYDVINATFVKGDYSILSDSKILLDMNYGVLILSGNGARISVNSPKTNDETQFLVTSPHSSVIIIGLTIEGFNIAITNNGALNIFNSTLKNNKVDYMIKNDYGGAIVNNHGGSITIYNSTLAGNYAKYGGAIYNSGTLKVFISNFGNNEAYDDDEYIDVYNNQTSVTVLSVEKYPTVKSKFPMAAWKEDLIYVGVTVAITVVSAGISWGVSATGIAAAHLINVLVGAGVGAIGGSIHGYIYSSDHHDYSSFANKLIDGINAGIQAVMFGENLQALKEHGYIYPRQASPAEITKTGFNEFVTRFVNKISVDIGEIIDAANDSNTESIWISLIR